MQFGNPASPKPFAFSHLLRLPRATGEPGFAEIILHQVGRTQEAFDAFGSRALPRLA